MAALLENMTAGGFILDKIKREGDVALYKKSTRQGAPYGYEVVIIRTGRGKLEIYPDDEDFGTWGWSFNSLAKSEEFYGSLVQKRLAHGEK